MSEHRETSDGKQRREETLEIEMPEGPAEGDAGQGPLSVGSRSGQGLSGISLRPGETLSQALLRVQREHNGAGAIYVVDLSAVPARRGGADE